MVATPGSGIRRVGQRQVGMAGSSRQIRENSVESELGSIRKSWKGRLKVALVYPNTYHVGMSNLGFQTVYRLFNRFDHVVCERAFLPDEDRRGTGRIVSMESGRPIGEFDIIAFSVSFENDFPHILDILEQAALPLQTGDRGVPHPLVTAGGVACFLNPEAIAPFIDCFFMGEAEALVSGFIEALDPSVGRQALLKQLAQKVPGLYVPAFYQPSYHADGTLGAFEPAADIPPTVQRVQATDFCRTAACSSAVITPRTLFGNTLLTEVGRGCPHGCRFCSAGYIYRPPRFKTAAAVETAIVDGAALTDKIGLVGAAVSDFPDLDRICHLAHERQFDLSFSSLRADALTSELIATLRRNKVKTATIAPDAGSERMRRVINKGIGEADILDGAEALVSGGIPNLKLYFMVGLPTETDDDVEAIVELCKKIKHRFLKSSRARKKIGGITVSLNTFVPKPFTPFQWEPMADLPLIKARIGRVRSGLKKVPNVRLHADIPRWAYLQGLFSRGDRRVSDLLLRAHHNGGNWPKTLKESAVNADFYNYRRRALDERLPWDFIDTGIRKSFLQREYRRALAGKTSPPCSMEPCRECRICMDVHPT